MNRNRILLLIPFILLSFLHANGYDFPKVLVSDETFDMPDSGTTCVKVDVPGKVSSMISDSIPFPWSEIDITAAEAKVLDVVAVVEGGAFPWIPVIGGVVVAGTVTYFLTKDDGGDPVDCSFSASAQTTGTTCGQSNGGVSVQVNPAGEYTYAWSNGSTGSMISDASAGAYTVTITRTGTTCTEVVTANIPNQNPSFDATITTQPTACDSETGSVTVTPVPNGTYTFLWSNGATTQNQNNLAAGNYTVTISAGGTCERSFAAQIGTAPFEVTLSFTTTPSTCGLSDGTAIVEVDPPGTYTYAWSNGQSGPQASGLAEGTYTVTVSKPGTSCSVENSVMIDENTPDFSITISSTPSGCGLTDGTATAVVDLPGEYTYAWSNGQSGAQVTGLGAGTYNVTVTIAGTTCSQEASVTVDELSAGFTVSVSSTPSGCGLTDGTATAVVDLPGEYTYAWSNGQSNAQATGLGAGTYNVTVSITGTTCSQEASVTVDELSAGFTVSVSSTPSGCGLTDGTATAVVDLPGEYTYAWSNGQTGPQATGLGAGTYNVTVSITGTNCTQEGSVTIDELPAGFTASVSSTPSGCGIADGTATATIDPPGEYTIMWSNGQSGPQATGLTAGNYSVSVTAVGSTCEVSVSFTVEQSGSNFTGVITTTDASCGIADGTATIVIDPPGEYMYAWSNGQTGPVANTLSAGMYTVSVTDINQCTNTFTATILEEQPIYVLILNTTSGTCAGGGEINFALSTPGAGPLVVEVTGPEGNTTQTLAPGTYSLSAFLQVTSGTYTFTVYDEQIGTVCTQTVVATVGDNTPPLVVTDDFYTTPGGQSMSGNTLDNDSGLNIQITDVSDVFGGTVTFASDGEFTFIPDQGFSGEASFRYTVTDACGNISTGIVTITVEQAICDFNAEFESTPASCGLEDGSATVDVIEPGTYSYTWSNGDNGPTINGVFAGTYTVTITDINLGCDLTFSTDIPENPAEYIEDIFITQPTCGVDGEIRFTANTNSGNQLILTITHPNGSDQFFVESGDIFLSDYISVTPGDYLVEVSDAGAGGDCVESFEATLIAAPMLEIIVEAVIPPTEPTAMDGIAIIIAIVPGTLPYEILLNGSSWGLALDNAFQVTGLGVGTYMVQIVDATGCVSNVLNFLVPPPPITMSFGTSMMQTEVSESNAEPVTHEPATLWRNVVFGSMDYYIGNVRQEVIARYAVPVAGYSGFAEVVWLTDIGRYTFKNIGFVLQGGLGSHFEKHEGSSANTIGQPNYLLLKASGGYTLARQFRFYGSLEVRGWTAIDIPRMEFGVRIPFLKGKCRWVN